MIPGFSKRSGCVQLHGVIWTNGKLNEGIVRNCWRSYYKNVWIFYKVWRSKNKYLIKWQKDKILKYYDYNLIKYYYLSKSKWNFKPRLMVSNGWVFSTVREHLKNTS
jgi:hypothetical protein